MALPLPDPERQRSMSDQGDIDSNSDTDKFQDIQDDLNQLEMIQSPSPHGSPGSEVLSESHSLLGLGSLEFVAVAAPDPAMMLDEIQNLEEVPDTVAVPEPEPAMMPVDNVSDDLQNLGEEVPPVLMITVAPEPPAPNYLGHSSVPAPSPMMNLAGLPVPIGSPISYGPDNPCLPIQSLGALNFSETAPKAQPSEPVPGDPPPARPGCPKCRFARTGCGECAPDIPRRQYKKRQQDSATKDGKKAKTMKKPAACKRPSAAVCKRPARAANDAASSSSGGPGLPPDDDADQPEDPATTDGKDSVTL